MSGKYVWLVRHPGSDEAAVFSKQEAAEGLAAMFEGAFVTKEPLIGSDPSDRETVAEWLRLRVREAAPAGEEGGSYGV
jgi:hypothetical protein